MRNKIILLAVLLVMLIGFSSCTMHVVSGTPYKVWSPRHRTSHHWGREKHMNTRNMFWGKHRYGPRPYHNRSKFHD